MSDFVFNIAKGRVAEYAARVNANDPAAATLLVCFFNAGGVTDAVLKDLDTVAAIEATAAAELTAGSNVNYARKVLTDTSSITIVTDDSTDVTYADIPDQTFSALGAGTAVTDVLIAYDDGVSSIPLTWHDFALTPDGSDVIVRVPSGFFLAT